SVISSSFNAFEPSLDRRLSAARQAQVSWSSTPVRHRLKRVKAFRKLLAERALSLATSFDLPERKDRAETLVAEILPLAEACRFLERRSFGILRPQVSGGLRSVLPGGVAIRIERAPWGLVLVICAGNYPLFLPGVQALQTLVAGNAVVLKPAPGTTAAVHSLRKLFVDAGFDSRLIVLLDESPDSASRVIESGVDKVLFTGSSRTGEQVLTQLARHLTPAILELSGCDAVFVHPEADLDLVADALEFGLRFNSSATCIAPRRVFLDRSGARELEQRLEGRLANFEPSHLSEDRSRLMNRLVEMAIQSGARRVGHSSESHLEGGPVILADVRPEMEVAQTDLFAPLVSIIEAASFEEALSLDALCPYSLGASVFGPRRKAEKWAREIEAGVVVINDLIVPTADPRIPFGGRNKSGFGVTRGADGLLALTRPRVQVHRRGRWRPHFERLESGDEVLFSELIQARHAATWRQRLRGWMGFSRAARERARQVGK
ncbi:MAG: aldehyde dehydrogenase family protein, partial [Acidobacteriota bacterium]